MRLYPPHVLKIFVRNRLDDGLTSAQIAAELRAQLKWDRIDLSALDAYGQERYQRIADYLKELECTD